MFVFLVSENLIPPTCREVVGCFIRLGRLRENGLQKYLSQIVQYLFRDDRGFGLFVSDMLALLVHFSK